MTQPDIQILDTAPEHLRLMASTMSADTAETALKLGMSVNQALWKSFKMSIYCKTAFINGKIAAIWGVGGSPFSDIAFPWLVMSDEAGEKPFKVAFIYRQELKKMQELFPTLVDYVNEKNEKAIRMLELMGFKIGHDAIRVGEVDLRCAMRSA